MEYDILIVGGGMVGASLACALQKTPLRIALIDATSFEPIEDARLIALNYNSFCLFNNIGIGSSLSEHATPIKKIHVSHRGHFGTAEISAHELDLAVLGYVVPAKYINTALYEKLNQLKNVTLIRPATLTQLTQDSHSAIATTHTASGTQTFTAKIIVAADGTHSTVRDLLNISSDIIDYQQKAIVTMSELQRDHKNVAYERFIEKGAIAMLPLKDQYTATIWTDKTSTINQLMQLSDTAFLAELQKQFGYRLGRIHHIQKRSVYPLKLIRATEQMKQRTILIGNAAHTIHPIAAQGFNLALHEIIELVDHFTKQSTLSLPSQLSSKQQQMTIQLSHRLSWIFSTDFFPFNIARQLSLVGLDMCSLAKKRFARKAMVMKTL